MDGPTFFHPFNLRHCLRIGIQCEPEKRYFSCEQNAFTLGTYGEFEANLEILKFAEHSEAFDQIANPIRKTSMELLYKYKFALKGPASSSKITLRRNLLNRTKNLSGMFEDFFTHQEVRLCYQRPVLSISWNPFERFPASFRRCRVQKKFVCE